MGNKPGKKVKSGWYQNFTALPCTPCCKRRKRSAPTVDIAEKSADPSSSPFTKTSTTISPPRSPAVPPSPLVTEISHISTAGGHTLTGLTLVTPSPQQPSPWVPFASTRSHATQLSTSSNTHISKGKQPEKDASTVDSDPDNLDKIFEEAWEPGGGLKLADGSELPWSRGTSSPSAAARYLDDIEDELSGTWSPSTAARYLDDIEDGC